MALIEFLFRDRVTIRPFLRQGNGEPVFGEAEQRRCRMQRGLHLRTTYKNPDGEVVQNRANAKMWCCGAPIPTGSQVTYTDENGLITRMIVLDCYVAKGFADDHLEVLLE